MNYLNISYRIFNKRGLNPRSRPLSIFVISLSDTKQGSQAFVNTRESHECHSQQTSCYQSDSHTVHTLRNVYQAQLFADTCKQLSLVNIPKGMDGMAIALVTAGLLAMAFMGFSGVDKGLAALFGV